ncbi:hypothetical protein IU433_12125 [Nocardia puris]|uniref:hypothetical protein n=1 Tax=Nocardia puris TaxID=208602 RepID=UPI0018948F00|nr:hypothetical protein [Nocardia puris]MBF6459783.1 hypothetical protein [Nocardia puris]
MSESEFQPGDRIEWWDNGQGARREPGDEDAVRHEGIVTEAVRGKTGEGPIVAFFVERRNGLGEVWTSWVRVGWARRVN